MGVDETREIKEGESDGGVDGSTGKWVSRVKLPDQKRTLWGRD